MSSPVKKTVELFYDVISPYTWIAFEVLCRYRSKWNMDLQLKPFFLGGIMQSAGNKPPMTIPAKGAYMMHDLARLRQLYHIPLSIPSDPVNTIVVKGSLNALRFITAVQSEKPDLTEPLSREMWMRVWSRDEDITTNESLTEAGRKVGLSEEEIVAFLKHAKDNDIKEKLKKTTQEALDAGAFGAPTIIVHDASNQKHMVFGSDRMQVIAMLLHEKYVGPLTELSKTKL